MVNLVDSFNGGDNVFNLLDFSKLARTRWAGKNGGTSPSGTASPFALSGARPGPGRAGDGETGGGDASREFWEGGEGGSQLRTHR